MDVEHDVDVVDNVVAEHDVSDVRAGDDGENVHGHVDVEQGMECHVGAANDDVDVEHHVDVVDDGDVERDVGDGDDVDVETVHGHVDVEHGVEDDVGVVDDDVDV